MERNRHNVGLKRLVIQSCRAPSKKCKADLKTLVKKVTWDDVMEMGSDYDETETEIEEDTYESDSDEFYDFGYWGPRRHYHF